LIINQLILITSSLTLYNKGTKKGYNMKKIVTTILGVSLLTGALFASEKGMMNHTNKSEMKMMGMHNMKMMNKTEMTKMHKECLAVMENKQIIHNSSNESTLKSPLDILEELYNENDSLEGGG